MNDKEYKDQITDFIMNSSNIDHLIVATFIAGMRAKESEKNLILCVEKNEKKKENL